MIRYKIGTAQKAQKAATLLHIFWTMFKAYTIE